jgi:transcriptional regulator with XRE-family HTH domain
MTLDRTTTDPRQLSAAAFRVTREHLGLTVDWVADRMGVQPRTVHRWEAGASPVPEGVRIELEDLATAASDTVAEWVAKLRGQDQPSIRTYRTDADYRRRVQGGRLPASWHRAVVARVAQEVPGLAITYWSAQ